MKKNIVVFLLACAVTTVSACTSGDSMDPGPVRPDSVVSMPAFSFAPYTINVLTGQTVIYDFPSESHNVIFQKRAGVPADIQETINRRVSRTFNTAGTFPYDCTIHPGMSGIVVVE